MALAPAQALAIATRDNLLLLSVPEIYGIDMAWYADAESGGSVVTQPLNELMEEARESTRSYLAATATRVQSAGAAVTTRVDEREPAEAILHAAAECDAWIIAMATHGQGGVTRWAFGSVADEVLRRSRQPVLLVRASSSWTGLRHVMVPLDGSDLAEAILPTVERLAVALGARVSLETVGAEATAANIPPRFLDARKNYALRLQDYLARKADLMGASGVEARSALVSAHSPAEALLDWEAGHAVDLVAMTTHGHGGLARAAFGSVADRMIREGSAPVLVKRVD
jgi:nucleotide-binding universal stress UspA family protein